MKNLRIYLAFLVAPMAPALVWLTVLYGHSALDKFLVFFTMGAYLYTLIVGVPLYFILQSKGWLKLWHVALAGFLSLFCITLFALLWISAGYDNLFMSGVDVVKDGEITLAGLGVRFVQAVKYGLTAALGAAVFWFIAYWKKNRSDAGIR